MRKRSWYIALAMLTILAGLASRSQLLPSRSFVATYGGDTLWALVVFSGFCILFPRWRTWAIALVAVLFSFAVEFSQFYHAVWIDRLRATTLGGLILGFGFKASDLVCYSVGIILGATLDQIILRITASNNKGSSSVEYRKP